MSSEETKPHYFSVLALLATLCFSIITGCAPVTWVSVTPTAGVQADGDSIDPVASASGRYVAFASYANNLVGNDTNAFKDIFVRDNQLGTTELISKSTQGGSANNTSGQPDITTDARYVVYWSFADDIVASDTNLSSDVFIYDRQTGSTERVSVDSNENERPGTSLGGSVSDDERFIVFYTTASFAANDTNANFDIYKRDRQAGTTTLVSVNTSGNAAGSSFDTVISRDGQSIIYWSSASDITSGDTNGFSDVFGVTALIPATLNLTSGGNGHSYTGDLGAGFIPTIVFSSAADNLVSGDNNGVSDIFILEWTGFNGVLRRITDGNAGSSNPVITNTIPNQSLAVAFTSGATDLQEPGASPLDTNGVSDVYLWERNPLTAFSGSTRLMSQSFEAGLANGHSSRRPAISPEGTAVVYASQATNLPTSADTNGYDDVFARPTWVPTITGVTGTLTAGATSVLTLSGKFRPTGLADQPLLVGKGVTSLTVNSLGYTSMVISVTLAANAKLGSRDLIVYHAAPELGMSAPLGSADSIKVTVTP